jgi:hypothetical protein
VVLSFPPLPGLLQRILILATLKPVASEASSIELNSWVLPFLKVALQDVSST